MMMAAACGKDSGTGAGGGGGGGGPDANDLGTPAFMTQSPDIMLAPGQELTYCWWFHTSNTSDVVINKWVSHMTNGHHLILFTGGNEHADGLDTTNSCGLGTSGVSQNQPIWVYASQQADQEEDLPPDDGSGKPLGQKIAANTEAAIQMHYLNSGDNTVVAHDELEAYALPSGADFTETDAYITYNNAISIPPNSMNTLITASCNLPTGVKFWTLSTHSHKQSVETKIYDGSGMILDSADWEHPTIMNWTTPSTFYSFTNSQLTWSCNYDNDAPPPYEDSTPPGTSNADRTITAGPSAATNEMCMAVGYFFPATGPFFGLNTAQGSCFSGQL
ncbi:MAG TPA: hypothetical protein VMJ10_08975 [Kofleriaceae bacterium]|nr:hypothetical protein [Kofleriaceae bacterium]